MKVTNKRRQSNTTLKKNHISVTENDRWISCGGLMFSRSGSCGRLSKSKDDHAHENSVDACVVNIDTQLSFPYSTINITLPSNTASLDIEDNEDNSEEKNKYSNSNTTPVNTTTMVLTSTFDYGPDTGVNFKSFVDNPHGTAYVYSLPKLFNYTDDYEGLPLSTPMDLNVDLMPWPLSMYITPTPAMVVIFYDGPTTNISNDSNLTRTLSSSSLYSGSVRLKDYVTCASRLVLWNVVFQTDKYSVDKTRGGMYDPYHMCQTIRKPSKILKQSQVQTPMTVNKTTKNAKNAKNIRKSKNNNNPSEKHKRVENDTTLPSATTQPTTSVTSCSTNTLKMNTVARGCTTEDLVMTASSSHNKIHDYKFKNQHNTPSTFPFRSKSLLKPKPSKGLYKELTNYNTQGCKNHSQHDHDNTIDPYTLKYNTKQQCGAGIIGNDDGGGGINDNQNVKTNEIEDDNAYNDEDDDKDEDDSEDDGNDKDDSEDDSEDDNKDDSEEEDDDEDDDEDDHEDDDDEDDDDNENDNENENENDDDDNDDDDDDNEDDDDHTFTNSDVFDDDNDMCDNDDVNINDEDEEDDDDGDDHDNDDDDNDYNEEVNRRKPK